MSDLTDKLTAFIDSGALQGTLYRHAYNMGVYYSPELWHDPHYGYQQQSHKWLYLGVEGWYPSEAGKALFGTVKAMAGDLFPSYPGEYAEFRPQLTLDI